MMIKKDKTNTWFVSLIIEQFCYDTVMSINLSNDFNLSLVHKYFAWLCRDSSSLDDHIKNKIIIDQSTDDNIKIK